MFRSTLRFILFGVVISALTLGSIAFVAYAVLVSSGPYSDAHFQSKTVVPCENIAVVIAGDLAVRWDVDDRFLLAFGDGLEVKHGTKVKDLPENWSIDFVTSTTSGRVYNVVDENGKLIMYVKSNGSDEIIYLGVFCGRRTGVQFVDLRSSRRLDLFSVNSKDLKAFFRSLPK